MLKTIGVCIAILSLGTIAAGASDRDALEIEGSYILYQDDGHQRVLSFNRSGNVIQASDLETVVGFTSGLAGCGKRWRDGDDLVGSKHLATRCGM